MLTTNRSYDVDYYHRPSQTMSLVLRNQVLSDNYGHPSYPSRRDTPVPDLEGKIPATHRKRVPVACERCRKRKIKCSGDQGDGSGCDNCKSAGHDGCQFLRVRSEALQCHSAYSTPRWHGHHYHPYSRTHSVSSAHHPHQLQPHQTHQRVEQHTLPYTVWQNPIEYSEMSTATSPSVSWNPSSYSSNYQLYNTESISPYQTHPHSYILPGPGSTTNSGVHYMGSVSRPQQNPVWLESTNSASIPQHNTQAISPIYPLTPAESTKSYSLHGQSTFSNLSYERTLPTPRIRSIHESMPAHGRETPPLSAVSHRSSHTWNTESASSLSATSSRTSCGGSQDLNAAAQALMACGDQGTVYSYQDDETNSHLKTQLPATFEGDERHTEAHQQMSQSVRSDEVAAQIHHRASGDNLRTSSPTMYNYPIHRPCRRQRGVLPSRLLTDFSTSSLPTVWNPSPLTPSSRQDSATSQTATHQHDEASEEYNDYADQETVPVLTSTY